jgi:polyisoprenoid-binding protein YceI
MIRRLTALPILMGVILAACGGGATPTAEQFTPTEVSQPAGGATDVAPSGAAGSGTTYQLVADQSTATFTIDEVLLGQPNTVVGTSHDIQGSFSLDLSDPASAQFEPVVINADSFATDDDRRNGAIRRFILQTNQAANQTVSFQPTSVDGLPASAEVGTTYDVSVTGDLTLHGITQSVTFDGQVTPTSTDEVQGSLSASVPRADFDLNIPNVPSVADVQESVQLQLDFVATRG